jgi:hypothetical protein
MSGLQCAFCNRLCEVSSANKTEFHILSSASILHEVIGARLRRPLLEVPPYPASRAAKLAISFANCTGSSIGIKWPLPLMILNSAFGR